MAKKKRKAKGKAAPSGMADWRKGMTLEEAVDHLRRDTSAKFDNLNRIILPFVDRIRILKSIAQHISALAKDDL